MKSGNSSKQQMLQHLEAAGPYLTACKTAASSSTTSSNTGSMVMFSCELAGAGHKTAGQVTVVAGQQQQQQQQGPGLHGLAGSTRMCVCHRRRAALARVVTAACSSRLQLQVRCMLCIDASVLQAMLPLAAASIAALG
jgi:hypothetical protein